MTGHEYNDLGEGRIGGRVVAQHGYSELSVPKGAQQGAQQGAQRLSHKGPLNIVVLSPDEELVLSGFDAFLTDNDDTLSRSAGELAHDGPEAVFAQLISKKLVEFDPTLANETNYNSTGSIFTTPEGWQKYRDRLGGTPASNIEGMLRVAEIEYEEIGFKGCFDKERDLAQLDALYAKPGDWMHGIQPDAGLISFIKAANKPTAMVTASRESYTHALLEEKKLGDLFSVVICNAQKKVGKGFSGVSLIDACEQLQVSPSRTVMSGDTMSDVGAAKLAGVPVTIIRLYDHLELAPDLNQAAEQGEIDREVEKQVEFVNQIHSFQQHSENSPLLWESPYTQTVIIIKCFSQVKYAELPTSNAGDTPEYEVRRKFSALEQSVATQSSEHHLSLGNSTKKLGEIKLGKEAIEGKTYGHLPKFAK